MEPEEPQRGRSKSHKALSKPKPAASQPKAAAQPAVSIVKPANANNDNDLPPAYLRKARQLLTQYNSSRSPLQYKKALKIANEILKEYPNNGETLAIKALVHKVFYEKEQAIEFAKKGALAGKNSHFCWRALGLVYKDAWDSKSAVGAYKKALACPKDDENQWDQTMRDLSVAQLQIRDLEGFAATRKALLDKKPTVPSYWLGYILALHLQHNYSAASHCFNSLINIIDKPDENTSLQDKIKYSELMLYGAYLAMEKGDYDEALKILKGNESHILDKVALKEMKGDIFTKLKNDKDAAAIYEELLGSNADNWLYHKRWLAALHLIDENKKEVLDQPKLGQAYAAFFKKYPDHDMSLHAKYSVFLAYLSGDKFKEKFGDYLKLTLRRSGHTAWSIMEPLYEDIEKVSIIGELIDSYVDSLRKNPSCFPGSDQVETPDILVWALLFQAQHYDKLGQSEKAFALIDEAINHTPTAIDLYTHKAKFYKHAGDLVAAAELMDKARQLDLQDRDLNSKAWKACLRANMIEKAGKIIALFGSDYETGESNLYFMQHSQYEQALGRAHFRLGNLGQALKQHTNTEKHFIEIREDNRGYLDWLSQVTNKSYTMRTYLDFLHFQDNLHAEKSYWKAMLAIIEIYLQIYDTSQNTLYDTSKKSQISSENKQLSSENNAPKKLTNAEKKAEAKRVKEAATGKAMSTPLAVWQKKLENVDPDPLGEKLLKVADPLAEAYKYLRYILDANPNNLDVQLAAFEVFMRKKKYLSALKALKKAIVLAGAEDAHVHKMKIRFFKTIDETKNLNAIVSEVISLERNRPELLGSCTSLKEYNDLYLNKWKTSIWKRAAAAEMMVLLDLSQKEQAIDLLCSLEGSDGTLQNHVAIHHIIDEVLGAHEAAQQYKEQCYKKFPYACYFAPQEMVLKNVKAIEEQFKELELNDDGAYPSGDVDYFVKLRNKLDTSGD